MEITQKALKLRTLNIFPGITLVLIHQKLETISK